MPATRPTDDCEYGRFLFRFAVFGDTHINPVEGESPSPWPTNAEANARARAAVREINRLRPAFAVHMGDMVHPVPAQESYGTAARNARQIFGELEAPIHYVAGNHDAGDKAVEWMPAAVVNEPFIDAYKRAFGPDRQVFRHGDCRFIVINAQLLNSGLEDEEDQWLWLEEELGTDTGERTFLFTHYPPYIAYPDEGEHYDNIGEPARSRLLDLTGKGRVEAVLGAHVHNFFYDRRRGTDFYVMPAVSAIRHDYSELSRVAPEDSEFGRNDNAKLGFFVFDVYERGHVPHFVRSYGSTVTQDGAGQNRHTHPRSNSRLAGGSPVGVDLRQAWGKAQEVPYAGGVDEFYRKAARNDYFLAALWETGVRWLRVPADDLRDPEVRARMKAMRALGHRFLLFTYGGPDDRLVQTMTDNEGLVSAVEVVLPWQRATAAFEALAALRRATGIPVYLSRLRSSAEAKASGIRYTHFVAHGLGAGDERHADELLLQPAAREAFDGVTFRVESADDPFERIAAAGEWAERQDLRALVHVTLADADPAQMPSDEAAVTSRIATSAFAAHATAERCHVFLDTFADMDRGYFPRQGLVDRRFNPRRGSRAVAGLHALLAEREHLSPRPAREVDGGVVLTADDAGVEVRLVLPAPRMRLSQVHPGREGAGVRAVDVESGQDLALGSAAPEWVERPLLLIAGDGARRQAERKARADA